MVTWPAGFTEVVNFASGSQKIKVAWKRLTGADTGNYTATWSGQQWAMAHCVLVTGGISSGDPIEATNTAAATSTTVASTSVTTVTEPFLGHFVANVNAATSTPPTSYTELLDESYLHSNYRIPATTGSHTASGGTLSVSTLTVVALVAVKPEATGATDLTVAGAAQAQTAQNVALTQAHNPVVQTAIQAQSADSPALTQVHNLVVAGAQQAQAADNVSLTIPGADLSVDNARQLQLATGDLALTEIPRPLVLELRVLFPTYELPAGRGRLFGRYMLDYPKSLVKLDGVWREVITPHQQTLEEADDYYQGGRTYVLTQGEADDLGEQYVEEVWV